MKPGEVQNAATTSIVFLAVNMGPTSSGAGSDLTCIRQDHRPRGPNSGSTYSPPRGLILATSEDFHMATDNRNARLTPHGRRLTIQRVREDGWPVAHAAKAMGVSRQCAHRWLARWDAEGDASLEDRSSRPHTSPNRTPAEVEERVIGRPVAGFGRAQIGLDPSWGWHRGQ